MGISRSNVGASIISSAIFVYVFVSSFVWATTKRSWTTSSTVEYAWFFFRQMNVHVYTLNSGISSDLRASWNGNGTWILTKNSKENICMDGAHTYSNERQFFLQFYFGPDKLLALKESNGKKAGNESLIISNHFLDYHPNNWNGENIAMMPIRVINRVQWSTFVFHSNSSFVSNSSCANGHYHCTLQRIY